MIKGHKDHFSWLYFKNKRQCYLERFRAGGKKILLFIYSKKKIKKIEESIIGFQKQDGSSMALKKKSTVILFLFYLTAQEASRNLFLLALCYVTKCYILPL